MKITIQLLNESREPLSMQMTFDVKTCKKELQSLIDKHFQDAVWIRVGIGQNISLLKLNDFLKK